MILPHITKQLVYASPVDFEHLLKYKSIKLQDLVDPDLAEKATQLLLGCCAVILNRGSYNLFFLIFLKPHGVSWRRPQLFKFVFDQVQEKRLLLLGVGEVELVYR